MQPLRPGDPSYIGEYELTGFLGEGGMGQVYLGKSRLGTLVAVKVMGSRHAGNAEFVERFRREVSAAMRVSGAYTAPVVNADPDGDPPWLATTFIPGPSLLRVVAEQGPLSVGETWWLAGGLVEALEAVHRSRLIHRDLKPQNIMLASDGPKVIDFGVAKPVRGWRGESADITLPGVLIGTPVYMSPEQLLGEEVGVQSDVYSLGVVLAHASTGVAPEATQRSTEFPAWRKPDVQTCPAELRDLLAGCLARQPASRLSLLDLRSMIVDGRKSYPQAVPSFWPDPLASWVRSAEDRARQGLAGHGASGGPDPHRDARRGRNEYQGGRPYPVTKPFSGGGASGHAPTETGRAPAPPRPRSVPPKRVPLEDQLLAIYRPNVRPGGRGRPGDALDATAHALAGERHWDQGRYTAAEDAYLASLGLDPDDPVVHVDLGRAQCKQRRYGDAERAFFGAMRINPDLIAPHWNLYLAVKLGGGRDTAATEHRYELGQACEYVLGLDAYSAAEHANRGDALRCLSRGGEAVSAYQAALALDPDSPRILEKLRSVK
jgi:hypothetical protein